mmetsp:Transcript_111273/g.310889  ORF Transcript_111273/g.310889 Transcript_111273/m.310889 type:complete len:296 (-) Transcript_111273:163-1050(-)
MMHAVEGDELVGSQDSPRGCADSPVGGMEGAESGHAPPQTRCRQVAHRAAVGLVAGLVIVALGALAGVRPPPAPAAERSGETIGAFDLLTTPIPAQAAAAPAKAAAPTAVAFLAPRASAAGGPSGSAKAKQDAKTLELLSMPLADMVRDARFRALPHERQQELEAQAKQLQNLKKIIRSPSFPGFSSAPSASSRQSAPGGPTSSTEWQAGLAKYHVQVLRCLNMPLADLPGSEELQSLPEQYRAYVLEEATRFAALQSKILPPPHIEGVVAPGHLDTQAAGEDTSEKLAHPPVKR